MILVTLVMGCLAMSAMAEVVTLEDYGISLEVPAGMTLEDVSDDSIVLVISNDTHQYTVSFAYDENYAGKTLADLDDAAKAEVEANVSGQIEGAVVQYQTDEAGQTYMMVGNPEETMAIIAVMMDGEITMVSAAKGDGAALTGDDATQLLGIMNSIAFVGGEQTAE